MINGVHVLVYSTDAPADRAFLRDVLGFPHVDDGDGWLIFKMPPLELGVHPTDGPPSHQLYLMCDDVVATVAELSGQGVEIVSEPRDAGFGIETVIRLPSGAELGIYQPRHKRAIDL